MESKSSNLYKNTLAPVKTHTHAGNESRVLCKCCPCNRNHRHDAKSSVTSQRCKVCNQLTHINYVVVSKMPEQHVKYDTFTTISETFNATFDSDP